METNTATQLREELDEARRDFRQTADEMRRDLSADRRRIEAEVRYNPIKSLAVAGALGFIVGRTSRHTAVLIAMLTGAAIGYAIGTANHPAGHNAEPAPVHNGGPSRSSDAI